VPHLHHRLEGSGPVVVLLHAGVADLRMWDVQATLLVGAGRTVVRCDLRGFGDSVLERGTSYCDAEDVRALLDGLSVGMFSLVGASYGGYVALQLASAVPERVDRLVLLAPAAQVAEPNPSLRALWEEEGRLMDAGDLDAATELNVRAWLGPSADEDARRLVRTMQRRALDIQSAAGDVEGRDLDVSPDRIGMPTTIFVGEHDQPFFHDIAEALAVQLAQAEVVRLPWAGHLPSLERPEETAALVLDALTAR
jgi:3-oxoadipate enol-lactonase